MFYATVQRLRLLDYVACKGTGHDIKRPVKDLLSIEFISSLSIILVITLMIGGFNKEGLANRIN